MLYNTAMSAVEKFFFRYKKHQFKRGEILIRADDAPSGIFYIKRGVVRQYYVSKNGDEITLNMFKSKAFFPMSFAIGGIHNSYYFEAMLDCVTYRAPRGDVLEFVKKKPEVLFDLLKRVYIGIEGLWMHIEYLAGGTALNKLIATLIILGKRFGKKDRKESMVIQLKLSEKELGEYAGIYRETVSRGFQILKAKGLISYAKGIIAIQSMQKLENELTL
jgi:CRP-like cAMP-binding protein